MEVDNKLLEKYISNHESICREERQYALFLYNYLCAIQKNPLAYKEDLIKKKIFGEENIDIKHIFYEAAFMRDFFWWDKKNRSTERRFNQYLLEYMQNIALNRKELRLSFSKWEYSEADSMRLEDSVKNMPEYYLNYHLGMAVNRQVGRGKESKKRIDLGENFNDLLMALMNSKPDIAVVYRRGEETYLQFLECKFESREGASGKKNGSILQTEAQDAIACFLTQDTEFKIANKWKKTKMVQFYRANMKESAEIIHIPICKLISHNSSFFEKQK